MKSACIAPRQGTNGVLVPRVLCWCVEHVGAGAGERAVEAEAVDAQVLERPRGHVACEKRGGQWKRQVLGESERRAFLVKGSERWARRMTGEKLTTGRSMGLGESGERERLRDAVRMVRKEGECMSISMASRRALGVEVVDGDKEARAPLWL